MPLNLRILQLYHRIPHPPRDGGVKAVLHMRQVLENLGCVVRGFALNPSRNRIDPSSLPNSMRDDYLLDIVELDSHIKVGGALAALPFSLPYHLLRFKDSNAAQRLGQIIEGYRPDLILLEGLPIALYRTTLEKFNCKILYRSHNIESDIVRQKAFSFSRWNPLRTWIYAEYRKMQAFERETVRTVDAVLAISPQDLIQLREMAPDRIDHMLHFGYWPTMANSSDSPNRPKQSVWNGERPLRLGFIGAMDWLPNQDALQWLVDEWIPATEGWTNRPEFHAAGRKAPAKFAQKWSACFFHGEVEDAETFMSSCDAMVFPLRMGSGLKIKAVEAMALGIPVISTMQGVQGMGLEPGIDYLQAENAREFAAVLQDLTQSPNQLQALTERVLLKINNYQEHNLKIKALSTLLEQVTARKGMTPRNENG